MLVSKTRFVNWTRCPMYFALDLKYNPLAVDDLDAELERRNEKINELANSVVSDNEEDEVFDQKTRNELDALLPYYNKVEEEALKVAKKYFKGKFVSDSKDVHNQKLFEYDLNGNTYRCYVDIYNENDEEINIIEVKAISSSRYVLHFDKKGKAEGLFFSEKRGGTKYPFFVKKDNIWHLNLKDSSISAKADAEFNAKKSKLLDRYSDEGKYPHDIAFQRFVIENALRKAGDRRRLNFYLAVLNKDYVYDGCIDSEGNRVYNEIDGQEIVTFFDMNEISKEYQPKILSEIDDLEKNILTLHDTEKPVPVGKWCAWGENTECTFCSHCFNRLRDVPEYNSANNYLNFRGFADGGIKDKYQLVNESYYRLDDVPIGWLKNENHKIQRGCHDNGSEYVDHDKMKFWFDQLSCPVYHLDFESFPCPLPRFSGETPYTQSVFEFSLHIEREPGVCDKEKDNVIFLCENFDDDERHALVEALIDKFEFNEDGTLIGTMLAQNTSFEVNRISELAKIFPEYGDKLQAICKSSADMIHLLKTNVDLYKNVFGEERAKTINYYHDDLSGSYSIKKTLPVLVPSLTYEGMDVGNGVQAYIAYLNYDSPKPTFEVLKTKADRRAALSRYCQQDTWAMVEILRAVRKKV